MTKIGCIFGIMGVSSIGVGAGDYRVILEPKTHLLSRHSDFTIEVG